MGSLTASSMSSRSPFLENAGIEEETADALSEYEIASYTCVMKYLKIRKFE